MPIRISDKKFTQIVGGIIAKYRIEKGFLQTELAEIVGVTSQHMNRIERGKVATTAETMLKLSIVFNCHLAALYPSPEEYTPILNIQLLQNAHRNAPRSNVPEPAILPLRKKKKRTEIEEYAILLDNLLQGDSLLYPAIDKKKILGAMKLFLRRHFVTKKEDDTQRRVWRVI